MPQKCREIDLPCVVTGSKQKQARASYVLPVSTRNRAKPIGWRWEDTVESMAWRDAMARKIRAGKNGSIEGLLRK